MDSIRIDIRTIKEGVNKYTFQVGPEEIGLEEDEGIYRKPVDVELEVTRTGPTVTVRGTVRTDVERSCGRCLAPFVENREAKIVEALRIDGETVRVFDERYDGDPGILSGPPGTLCFDELVRETILVGSPIQPVCRPDCRGLCPVCGVNRNEKECDCRTESSHPVWEALRELSEGSEKKEE